MPRNRNCTLFIDEWLPNSVTRTTRYLSAVPGTQAPGHPGKGPGGGVPCQHRIQRRASGSPRAGNPSLCYRWRHSRQQHSPQQRGQPFTEGDQEAHPPDAWIPFLRWHRGAAAGFLMTPYPEGGFQEEGQWGIGQLLPPSRGHGYTSFLTALFCIVVVVVF